MKREKEASKEILLKHGLKPTFQRLAIYDFLDENRIHPTVDQIYNNLHHKIPTISKTTIYNTLNIFLQKNLIQELTISGTEMHYDINVSPHHHFYCTNCRRVIDLDIDYPNDHDEIKMVNGHLIQEVHVYFKGICKDCKN